MVRMLQSTIRPLVVCHPKSRSPQHQYSSKNKIALLNYHQLIRYALMTIYTAFNKVIEENIMKSPRQKRCVIGIRGQTPDPDYPVDIWFDSLKSIANVLSQENQQLLKVIAEQQPQSITELAALTGRAVSNVSRTLKTLGKYNLVKMQSAKKMLSPKVSHQEFLVVVNNEK
jgi:predicted transcriptional regulator